MSSLHPAVEAVDSLVMFCEGLFLKSYRCPDGVLAIGYGHTGDDVHDDQIITRAQAIHLLLEDLSRSVDEISHYIERPMQPHQMGALASLVHNVGAYEIGDSSLMDYLNKGEIGVYDKISALYDINLKGMSHASHEWASFRVAQNVNGKRNIMPGLVRRRAYELELFHTGRWQPGPDDVQAHLVFCDSEPDQEPSAFGPGMISQEISQLHNALMFLGYNVQPGNVYSFATADAIRHFQGKNGLTADGLYGPATAKALSSSIQDTNTSQKHHLNGIMYA